MNKFKSAISRIATIIFFISVLPVYGQNIEIVEVNGFEGRPQQMSNWCWAASIQSIFLTKGLEIDQPTIVTAAYGAPENRTAPGFAGTLYLVNSLVVDVNGHSWRIQGGAGPTYPNPLWLLQRLRQNQPTMIWFQDPYENHSIVIHGGTYYTNVLREFLGWETLKAYDPYFGHDMIIDAANIPRFVYGTFQVDVIRDD